MAGLRHHFRDRSARAVHESHYGPNMTPMVDVVMVILIFFMASAAILGPEWFLKASLPVAGGKADAKPPVRLTITVEASGLGLQVDQGEIRRVERDALASSLAGAMKQAGRECVGVVKPGADAPYELVVAAFEACTKAGLLKSGLAPPETTPEPKPETTPESKSKTNSKTK